MSFRLEKGNKQPLVEACVITLFLYCFSPWTRGYHWIHCHWSSNPRPAPRAGPFLSSADRLPESQWQCPVFDTLAWNIRPFWWALGCGGGATAHTAGPRMSSVTWMFAVGSSSAQPRLWAFELVGLIVRAVLSCYTVDFHNHTVWLTCFHAQNLFQEVKTSCKLHLGEMCHLRI